MEGKGIALEQLVHELDELFAIHEWDRDPAASRWIPRLYQEIGYDHTQIFEVDFCQRTNGLMLRSGDEVKKAYCAAFPSPEILRELLEVSSEGAMLFLHHPFDMEVSGVGFLPIPPEALEQLKARGISVYACHAPMDCHDEVGTNASMVEAFGIQVEQHFARYGHGFAGRIGSITPTELGELARRGRAIFCVDRVEVGGGKPAIISRVAIVAGGGDDPELLEEAEQRGAQAYITGEWYTRTLPVGEEEKEWAEANKAACLAYAETSGMALLGFSHAASEYLVMKGQMIRFLEAKGVQATSMEPSDWWR
ncbi:MAG TPA: Nif3-like dinuclear metal center hexameric protein [Anaerolineae bacterium]|nr:Nif3-like dinuclear metal center hexameric protein [Anaerolineae bacterium]